MLKGAGEAGHGTAHDSNIRQGGRYVCNDLCRLAGCHSCSTGKSYRPLKHVVELAAVVELLGRVNLGRA